MVSMLDRRPVALELPTPPAPSVQRPAGPGLPESILWTLGYLLAQALAAGGLLALLLLAAKGEFPHDLSAVEGLLLEMNVDSTFLLTGVTSLGAVFLLAGAARLRLGATIRSQLHVRTPPMRDVLLSIGAVAPLAVVSNALYHGALRGWDVLARGNPELSGADGFNTLNVIPDQAAGVPFAILLVALALGPAVGEELVFRGVVGQGLIRRCGVGPGVLLASLLFAAAHLFPPHAVATLPLAVFFHYAYLSTRNFWIPVLLHFLNNALCLAMLKLPIVQDLPATPVVVAFSALYLVVIAVLLQERYAAGGAGASRALAWLRRESTCRASIGPAMAGCCIVGFTTTFVWSVILPPLP
jgi:hypothetical protein